MSASAEPLPSLPNDPKANRILTTARELFLERGYADTSMDAVANAARVSKTTLYTRFPSKEALFGAIIQSECVASGIVFDPMELADLPIEEALVRVACGLAEVFGSPARQRAEQILAAESGRFPQLIGIFNDAGPLRIHQSIASYFHTIARRADIKIEDPALTAHLFTMLMKGAFYIAIGDDHCPIAPSIDRNKLAREAVRLFLYGIIRPSH